MPKQKQKTNTGKLREYQNDALAARYRALVQRVKSAEETQVGGGTSDLAEAVARYYYKLLAYKDEYEVARIYSSPSFKEALEKNFEGDFKIEFNLAAPILAKKDPVTGQPLKRSFGAWMLTAFGMLSKFKFIRGTALDPFGHQSERRVERQLVADYEALVESLLLKDALDASTHSLAVELARIPEGIRGFGHVKARHIEEAKAKEHELMELLRGAPPVAVV